MSKQNIVKGGKRFEEGKGKVKRSREYSGEWARERRVSEQDKEYARERMGG